MQPAQGAENLLSLADPALLSYAVGMGGLPGRKYSENCLGLNIWTKKNNTGPPKAVLVWIYGGGKVYGMQCSKIDLTIEQDLLLGTQQLHTTTGQGLRPSKMLLLPV
jgi:hypothetical protein